MEIPPKAIAYATSMMRAAATDSVTPGGLEAGAREALQQRERIHLWTEWARECSASGLDTSSRTNTAGGDI